RASRAGTPHPHGPAYPLLRHPGARRGAAAASRPAHARRPAGGGLRRRRNRRSPPPRRHRGEGSLIMADEPVRSESKDGVLTLTLDRPDVLNAMNNAMRAQLLEIFARLRTDDTVKAVVITEAGAGAFCTGQDNSAFL